MVVKSPERRQSPLSPSTPLLGAHSPLWFCSYRDFAHQCHDTDQVQVLYASGAAQSSDLTLVLECSACDNFCKCLGRSKG